MSLVLIVGNNDNKEEDSNLKNKELEDHAVDELDYLPNSAHVTNWDILGLITSIITHIVDVGLDINIAYRYFHSSQTERCILTVIFILFPAFVNTVISIRMYALDKGNNNSVSKMASKKWIVRIFVLLLQLAPVLRYDICAEVAVGGAVSLPEKMMPEIAYLVCESELPVQSKKPDFSWMWITKYPLYCESLSYAFKSRRYEKQKDYPNQCKYYEKMLKEDSDVALLRVFECYLEAAPQQILQISILLVDTIEGSTFQWLHQACSIGSSLFSMAWSMASYQRCIRFVQENKDNLSWPGTVMQFLWHFMVTVSRILSISMIASLFPFWTSLACAVHWLAMASWLSLIERTKFCSSKQQPTCKEQMVEVLFAAILGLVYIFTYVTPREGKTRFNTRVSSKYQDAADKL